MRSSEIDVVVSTMSLRLLDLSGCLKRALKKVADLLRQLPLLLRRKKAPQSNLRERCALSLQVFDWTLVRPRHPHDARRARLEGDSPTAKESAQKCASVDSGLRQHPLNWMPDPWPTAR